MPNPIPQHPGSNPAQNENQDIQQLNIPEPQDQPQPQVPRPRRRRSPRLSEQTISNLHARRAQGESHSQIAQGLRLRLEFNLPQILRICHKLS